MKIAVTMACLALWAAPSAHAQRDDDRHGHGHHDHEREFVVPPERNFGSYYAEQGVYYYAPSRGSDRQRQPIKIVRGSFGHHEDLAGRLVNEANGLCLELHYNYSQNRGFRETYHEAYQILQTARYLERKEHRGDHDAIRNSVGELDNLFHHVEEDTANWRERPVRRVGTGDLDDKFMRTEAILHHLMYDVGVTPEHDQAHHAEAMSPDDEVAPPPGHGRNEPPGRRFGTPPPPPTRPRGL